jgi:glucose-1-phosphate cytidylyltransferase
MQVIILAGGLGTRLSEETHRIPKPLVTIANVPILFRIMKHFIKYGHSDFFVLGGYKFESISNYFLTSFDVVKKIELKSETKLKLRDKDHLFEVTVIDTGLHTSTGGRIKRVSSLLDDHFFSTYGDGMGDININNLMEFFFNSQTTASVTAVRPPARFGSLEIDGNLVIDFSEKVPQREGWINGGFFVFKKNICDYIEEGDSDVLERHTLPKLVKLSQLSAYRHEGFWHPMDTMRDKIHLEEIFKYGEFNHEEY